MATNPVLVSTNDEEATKPVSPIAAIPVLLAFAQADGDISDLEDDAGNRFISESKLVELANEVCDNYEQDKLSREDWEKVATKAVEDMAKADWGQKDTPWVKASNVHYPLLPYAVMQFNARSYPAIVKGDEAVNVKVVGNDNGLPQIGPDGQPMLQVQGMPVVMSPQGPVMMTPQGPQPAPPEAIQPVWAREPGAKAKRAQRVRDYMNTVLFYRMDDWESETDTLLFQMPAVGLGFRKTWFDGEKHQSRFVPALKLVVDNDAGSLADAPRITEEIEGVFPQHIRRDIRLGKYRPITLDPDETEARKLLEQQCHYDLDGDGLPEPYIVTVDYKSKQLLRVVPDFEAESVKIANGGVAYIERRTFYTKYEFLPHPEGKFYNIGLAHLLDQYGEVVNTIINQMVDANTAMVSGGGFIASGLRLQGSGQSSTLKWRPGHYFTVNGASGDQLRSGIVERTFPQLSPVMFQLLELILGAAKDIASIKDVLSGEASNQGQVGTTLALIEQGLQVFTAIYKRVYRGLKAEFSLLFHNIGKYADQGTQQDYMELLDDPSANFQADFNSSDMDIRPVSDPTSVTKMQRLSRAQFLMGTLEQVAQVGGDPREILKRVYEAADIEDIDKILPPKQPNPMDALQQQHLQARNDELQSRTVKNIADAKAKEAAANLDARGQAMDEANATIEAFQAGANSPQMMAANGQ